MYFSTLFLILLITLLNTHRTTVYGILEFESNTNDFYHVTTHNTSGDIYIGAHNALYRLSENFTVIANITTCQTSDCDNINKVLAIDYDHDKLITCGGGNNGRCEARSLVDLSLDGNDFEEGIVSGLSAVGIIAPGLDGNTVRTVLYISSGHKSLDSVEYYMNFNSKRSLQKESIFEVIQTAPDEYGNYNYDAISPSDNYKSNKRPLNFKSTFVYRNYTYFAAFRQKDILKDNNFYSRLSRVCRSNYFDTLSEINIRCVGNVDYNLIQTMSVGRVGSDLAASLGLQVGQDVLYGVFARGNGSGHPTGQSALCVYKWEIIEDAFFKALNGCLHHDSDQTQHNLNYANRAECGNRNYFTVTEVFSLMCPADVTNVHRVYSQGLYSEAAVSESMLTINGTIMTSITVAVEENHTIAFIGTDGGTLMKVEIMNQTSTRVYENVIVDAGQEVKSDTYLAESFNHVIVLTSKKLVKLPVANCSQFTTCDDCIRPIRQDGDPYCGWCTLQKICTRYKECKQVQWLPSNSAKCIEISNVEPPFIPYTDENIKVTLTVQQLPPLNTNQSYNCKFGDVVSPAMKQGEILTCTSPLTAQVPQIPPGNAFVDVPLLVHSSETNVDFVTSQFTFFDCNAITSCSECVTSFTCDWCLYGNKCTHNASLFCSADQIIQNGNAIADVVKGQGSCPQIHQINEEVIHVNVEKEVRIPVSNLPDATKVTGYECVLTIEGKKSTIAATVNESTSTIICSQYMYDYVVDEQEVTAGIQVIWNNNNLLDNTYRVTLYKCDVNRPDCSRCLSSNSTRPVLDCVWCGDQCSYDPFCSSKVNDCPGPVITQIFPESVATVTNQAEPSFVEVIELSGTNFGQTMSDIDNIIINNKECEIIEDGFSIDLQSVKCRAPVFNSAAQQNVIISVKGKTSPPVSIVYQNPTITDISPTFGILAGGTYLNIIGLYLNTGNEQEVSIGGSQCYITDVSETQIMCTTSIYTSEAKLQVTVKFGEAIRSGGDFTYTPNPTVSDVQPRSSIQAGGRTINVSGMDFQHVQVAKIFVNGIATNKSCDIVSNILMLCESPPADLLTSDHHRSRRQTDDADLPLMFSFDGFIPDLGDQFQLKFYPDPIYFLFSNETIYEELVKDGVYQINTDDSNILQLMGFNINLASDINDIEVFIGSVKCEVKSLSETLVIAEVPNKQPEPVDGQDYPLVMILHGNLEVTFGPIQYSAEFNLALFIQIMIPIICVAIIISLIVAAYYFRRIQHFDNQTKKVYFEMDNIQRQVQEEAQEAIADLTINLRDLTQDDIQGNEMPFVGHKKYVCNMMFNGFEIVPDFKEAEMQDDEKERNVLLRFSALLLNKDFLLTFIKVIDNNSSKASIQEKCNFASLLIVDMLIEEKMDYFTEVLEELLVDHIDDCMTSHKAKQVLVRTDAVTTKLLSNWIALSMYNYLKDYAGHPLYILYQAIKLRIEMGAVDAITEQSTYSLNLDYCLQSDVTVHDVTLDVIQNADSGEVQKVKVLSCDTITQVKEKILDALCKNEPYSTRPRAYNRDLNWQHGGSGHLILSDIDVTSERSGQWIKLNTLGDLIPMEVAKNGCTVILIEKQAVANANIDEKVVSPAALTGTNAQFEYDNLAMEPDNATKGPSTSAESEESGPIRYHLVKDKAKLGKDESKKKKLQKSIKTEFKEIKFPRAMATKEAIKKFVDDMFDCIFCASTSEPFIPSAIKYLFDLIDQQAVKHEVDQLTLVTWKSNSLFARFWVQVITHPELIFDIKKTGPIMVTLDIISRTFLDSCSPKKIQLTKESPINRLLYTQEMDHYRSLVSRYYENVKTSDFDRTTFFEELQNSCHDFKDIFSRTSTIKHIFSYAVEHREKLTAILKQDDSFETQRNLSELNNIFREFSTASPSDVHPHI